MTSPWLQSFKYLLKQSMINMSCPWKDINNTLYGFLFLDDLFVFSSGFQFIYLVNQTDSLQGVYALFFFKRRVRTIGHRLAGYLGKLRYTD